VRTLYFDYNATTPLDPEVRAAMMSFGEQVWGNPSSVHHVGRRARALLDGLRERAAGVLGCRPGEVTFTSGGTEANNLAVLGAARRLRERGRHLITSAVEHHAVLHAFRHLEQREGFCVTVLPVDRAGRVDPAAVRGAVRPDTVLVSVMAANNEVGTLQPVAEIGALCRTLGVVFHTDAAQWFGKEAFTDVHQFNADLVSLCAHKFHGPKGAGALFVRSPLLLEPLLLGGGQEQERRAGTENLAAIAGLVTAMERFLKPPVFSQDRLAVLRATVRAALARVEGVTVLAEGAPTLCNTLAFVVEGTDSFALLAGLDVEGVCASAGAACSAGSLEPSHVVAAMGYGPRLARSLVRLSTGRENTEEEIACLCALLPRVIARAKGG